MSPLAIDLTPLRYGGAALRARHGVRRAPSHRGYLAIALRRCALYLGPLGVAVAAAGPLSRVAWQVTTVTLVLGWSAAQALTSVGNSVARRVGRIGATRLVAGGFAAVAGLWCAIAWVAPSTLLGPDRLLAAVVGVGGIVSLATVAGALVTRCEAAVIRWSLPIWLIAGITAAGAWPPRVPPYALLCSAIVVAAVRAYRPVLIRPLPRRPALSRAEMRQGCGYLIIGAAQAVCVALLWRAGPAGTAPPAMLPLLVAVPMLEALVGWYGNSRASTEQPRGVTVVTVAGLLPPIAVGIALAVAAYRLPYGLSAYHGARDVVLSLAGGTLLAGVLAVTLLLAVRGHTATAATLAAGAPLLIAVATALPMSVDLLPTIVAILAVTHLVGLLAVARTALDHRRTP